MSNIISLILIIASFGLFFTYMDPTFSDIKELSAKRAEYDRALNNSLELQKERDKLLGVFNQMDVTNIGRLNTLLPDNIDNVRLIIDIDEMAKKFNMRIRDFGASATQGSGIIGEDQSPYGTLTLSFSTTATYNTFLAFLRDLERSLRIIDITAIQFTANDEGQLYDYNVTIKTYWLK